MTIFYYGVKENGQDRRMPRPMKSIIELIISSAFEQFLSSLFPKIVKIIAGRQICPRKQQQNAAGQ